VSRSLGPLSTGAALRGAAAMRISVHPGALERIRRNLAGADDGMTEF
jgi:hypothetical protein